MTLEKLCGSVVVNSSALNEGPKEELDVRPCIEIEVFAGVVFVESFPLESSKVLPDTSWIFCCS